MKLRDYQQEALAAIHEGFKSRNRLLAVLPTGAGKTILFAHIAASHTPHRTLVLAHREELLTQAIDKIHRATGLVAEMEKASHHASMSAQVVVASVQTMMSRKDRWPKDHFGLVVVDEAHHVLSDSYQSVVSHFHNNAKILGVTATPDRGDKRNLGAYFEEIAYEVGLARLVRDGYLSRIKVKKLPVTVDLRTVAKVAGDYKVSDLGEALSPRLWDVAKAIAAETRDRKTIVFLPLVEMARDFSGMLNKCGITSKAVAGVDSTDDRHGALAWFANAPKGTALCNAMLLTEGFDQPDVDCIAILRPTQVRALFAQMVGRGTRIHSGKEDLLLLDFLWQTDQHKLITISRLIAKSPDDVPGIEAAIEAGDEVFQSAEDVETQRLKKLLKTLDAVKERPAQTYDAVEMAYALDDEELLTYEPTMEWHHKEVSEAQNNILIRAGFDPGSVTCRGHASKILDKLAIRRAANLATPKQVRMLKRFGHPSPQTATFTQASAFITQKFGR